MDTILTISQVWKQYTRRVYLDFVLYLMWLVCSEVFPKYWLGNGLRGGVRVPLEHARMGLSRSV